MSKNGEKQEIVEDLVNILNEEFSIDSYIAKSHENLISTVRIDNNKDENAVRGKNAFQTDILIYKKVYHKDIEEIPMVVVELKTGQTESTPTTHDIILYSVKAMKHKAVYPQLRYGMVWFNGKKVPNRFILNNENMDFGFGFTSEGLGNTDELNIFIGIIKEQLETAEKTHSVLSGKQSVKLFSTKLRYE